MASTCLQILGLALSVVGWLGAIVSCALPMWKVTVFIGNNTEVDTWEGLWMSCVVQGAGQSRCVAYDSLLDLPQDLQAARALTVIGVVLAALGVFFGIIGANCCQCVKNLNTRWNLAVVAGFIFLVSGLLMLLTGSWSAHSIRQDFYNPLVTLDRKGQLGAAIYLALVAGGLLILGAVLLCCSWPKDSDRYPPAYLNATSTANKSTRSKA